MPARLRLPTRPIKLGQALLSARPTLPRSPACPFCSLQPSMLHRRASTISTSSPPSLNRTHPPPPPQPLQTPSSSIPVPTKPSSSARTDLASTLRALQHHLGIVDLRFQLALQSLQQPAGEESVRVAVWGLGQGTGRSAKELLRLVLVDPLQNEQPWEQELASHDPAKPLIVRVVDGQHGSIYKPLAASIHKAQVQFSTIPAATRAGEGEELAELEVSSPVFKGSQLMFLVLEALSPQDVHGSLLVPTVAGENPTPVHQALVVGDGVVGAVTVGSVLHGDAAVKGAINITAPEGKDCINQTGFPVYTFDPAAAREAITLFRTSVANAKAYERLWRRGGVTELTHWLRDSSTSPGHANGAKPAVRALIKSVLSAARADIVSKTTATANSSAAGQLEFSTLEKGLATWSEKAHAELQSELDQAFSGRRWRKIGWWKLFWRADDVSMLSSSLVTQRFLPRSEQDVVYLAGRIAEVGQRTMGRAVTYSAPVVTVEANEASDTTKTHKARPARPPTTWPTHISFTRNYLVNQTVPALQALADKLVVQTIGSSGMTAAVAALTFLSGGGAGFLAGEGLWVGTGVLGAGSLYEAGAVLGVGMVFSLGRMQNKWETAREFWESEVREEGRKAVRSVEASMAETLIEAQSQRKEPSPEEAVRQTLDEARALVEQAEEQLSRV